VQRRAVLICVLACLLPTAAPAEAKLSFKRCGGYGFKCARLSVPLDRTGAVPGGISLHVKRMRGRGKARPGALFAIAGGPGQSATDAFDGDTVGELSSGFRGRNLIVFDQRGTGRSGLLRCRRLEKANLLRAGKAAADCARSLGPRRAFYTTRDSVEDIEAIRRELGQSKIDLFGTSYGTKLALAYALRYPANVGRLVLDSVVEARGPDPLYRDTFAAVPRALRALCRSGCRGITRDPVGDLERLVARLARGPIRGRFGGPKGLRPGKITRLDLFVVLLGGDFDPALRAAFPAGVRSALAGDPAPFLRLKRRAATIDAEPPPPRVLSTGVYAAATCEETPFPWARTTPPAERHGLAAQAALAQPADAFRPFDVKTALATDLLNLCEPWPTAAAEPEIVRGPLPNVPTLLLEGEDDLRTPVENARRVAAALPQATMVVAPATGHSTLGSDASGCASRAFGRFFTGRRVSTRCPRAHRQIRPTPVAPLRLRDVQRARGVRGRRGRALTALALTLGDVADDASTSLIIDLSDRDLARGAGLRGGRYRVTGANTLRLRRVSFIPRVRVSGFLRHFAERRQRGRLRISGRATPDGVLRVRGRRIRGRLGGRRIRGRLSVRTTASVAHAAANDRPGPPLR